MCEPWLNNHDYPGAQSVEYVPSPSSAGFQFDHSVTSGVRMPRGHRNSDPCANLRSNELVQWAGTRCPKS